ncbi:MAG: hypothetical protein HYY04_14085 [Chloroflexi bacterium]|nr:hypothetical protein [Chloroflexota bacterium]
MDVLLVLGCQDVFPYDDPALDECLGWLADILGEEGLVATYLFQAERAEQLAAHGRWDVIRKVARHEVGLHGRDRHPVHPETIETLDWEAGVEALARIEGEELATLGRVFDRPPVGSSQHGPYSAPQLYEVVRRRAEPYLFGFPAAPPLYSVSRCWGALAIPFATPVPDFLGFAGVYDRVLHDDEAFADALARLGEHVARCLAGGQPLLSVFLCHPERLVYPEPVTRWRYADGQNCPDHTWQHLVTPVCRSRDEIGRALANFRQLVRALRGYPDVVPITVAELARRYGHEPAWVRRSNLLEAAERAAQKREIVLGPPLSPAEAVVGWAQSLVQWQESGELPERLPHPTVLGPPAAPSACPAREALAPAEVITLGKALAREVNASGHLPADLTVGGARLGLGSAYGALAQAYRDVARGQVRAATGLSAYPRYPALAAPLARLARSVEELPTVRPGLGTDRLALYTRLLTWTLKPAARMGDGG